MGHGRGHRRTARQTDRQTDRPADRPTKWNGSEHVVVVDVPPSPLRVQVFAVNKR